MTTGRLRLLQTGGLLHDLGKLGVGDGALHKNGSLTGKEFDKVRLHPVMGARILEGMEAFQDVVPIVLFHHESWDGSGYPDGLAHEAIPLEARIVAVVDMFDALTSDCPYRGASSVREALDTLRQQADVKLQGSLVAEWVALVSSQPQVLALPLKASD